MKFFANTEEPGTSFQVAVFVEFFDKFFFINRLHLHTKASSKMYFSSHA